jgi:hypothetical protein
MFGSMFIALTNAYVHDVIRGYEELTDHQKQKLILFVWLVPFFGAIYALISPHNPHKLITFSKEEEIGDYRLLYFAESYAETVHIECEFVAAGIPCFIQGRYLGDILPGPQVPWYNERRIFVPNMYLEQALQIVAGTRIEQGFSTRRNSWKENVRSIFEIILFGWYISSDRSPESDNKSLNADASDAGAG